MSLRELATTPATTCGPATGLEHVARLMAEANVGFVVVLDGTKPIGVVTDRDIVVRGLAQHRGKDTAVADVMSRPAACVSERASVADAAQIMADHTCRRLVVEADDGTVIGVLSLDDLLRVAGEELSHVAHAVRSARHAHDVMP
jgi:signal-transduction protein with cAMP-binding, CBS, and nucleotidyltransferase domain